MEENNKTLTVMDHARLRQKMYLHCDPEHAFGELFNGWTMLMDFVCAGISWDHSANINIDEQDGKCLFQVTGDISSKKVFDLLVEISARMHDKALSGKLPGSLIYNCGGMFTEEMLKDLHRKWMPSFLPIMLVIAYSQDIRLSATYGKQSIEMLLQGDMISSLECGKSEEADQWQLDFTPNPQYISAIDLGRHFKRECFRRVCAYSDALTIRVRGHEMHECSGTYAWLHLVAPYPYWKQSANIRKLVHKQFDIAFSFRPGTERRYEIFCAGHLSGGQPQQLLEHAFESYIAESYGEAALPKIRSLGFVAVLSILGFDSILRQSMGSDDCQIDEDSELHAEIKATLRRTFRDLNSLHDLLKEKYGLVPIE